MTNPADSPIVERFVLRGLNGYKTIELGASTAARIISAENGTGKTTILNAMYGVLSGKYSYVQKIDFTDLSVKFQGCEEITVSKEEIRNSSGYSIASLPKSVLGFFLRYGMDEDGLSDLIEAYRASPSEAEIHPLYQRLYTRSPHSKQEINLKLSEICSDIPVDSGEPNKFRSTIRDCLQGRRVIYFPTYRRIEAELSELSFLRREEQPPYSRHIAKRDYDDGRLINFGLRDVEERLESITDDIRRGTYEAYARISGRTLDQLVSTLEAPSDESSYDTAAIKVVLGRIGKSESNTERRILELITSGEISQRKHEYLRYFLAQMVDVYREKQLQESAVEKFALVVSQYWQVPESEKLFEFDKVSAEAKVRNIVTGSILNLNTLSSGEKQIISIFSRLYLELKEKYIVLIDEPELSLSMEWQKRLLPDMLAAPSCSQLIAITHSPFTFDNELDNFAGSLKIRTKK